MTHLPFVTIFSRRVFDALRAGHTPCFLPLVTACFFVFSYSLRAISTHDPSTAVRATTSLGGERAHQRCLFSPLPTVFSRALFSTTLPTLVENGHAEPLSRFHEINFFPLRFVQHRGNVQLHIVPHRGMGKKESGGLGEKTRKGKGDCSRAAPLSPGCLPKHPVERYCVTLARRL